MLYRLTLIGLYNYDKTIFDELTFPAGIDHQTAVDTICLRGGEMGCIYTNPDFLRFAMRNWSAKNSEPIARILRALTEDYNPIHNYDRYEEATDKGSDSYTRTGTATFKDNGSNSYTDSGSDGFTETREIDGTQSGTTTGTDSKTAEETVSADNVSTYQPDRKTEESGTSSATTSGSNSSTDEVTHSGTNSLTHSGTDQLTHTGEDVSVHDGSQDLKHNAHLYGNIGVTTSAQMIAGEMDIRRDYRIYDIISDMFVSEFCELTY